MTEGVQPEAEAVEPEPSAAPARDLSRKRRVLIWSLVVIGALCVAISIFSVWIREVALNDETWAEVSSEVLESENVQAVLTDYIVQQIFDSRDVQSSLEEALPDQLSRLAAPLAGALRQAADRTVSRLLASPRFQDLWRTANQAAHARLVAVLKGESERVSIQGNQVVLDLGPIIGDVATRVGLSSDAAARLSERAGEIVILENDQLQTVQKAVRILNSLSFFLTFVALIAWVLAVYLSRGRRRETVRAIAASLVLVGVLVLAVRALGGKAIVGAVVKTTSVEPAVHDVWEIFTEVLRDTTVALIVVGALVLLWVWLTGPGRRAVAFRRAAGPTFRDHPAFVHGGLALILLLFLVWGPIGAPRRIFTMLILVVLAFVGLELLRRQAVRELPEGAEEERTGSPAAPA